MYLEFIAWEENWTILKDCQIYRYFIRMDLEKKNFQNEHVEKIWDKCNSKKYARKCS